MGDCPFCDRIREGRDLVASSDAAVAFKDGFPVSDGHLLIVPRRHVHRIEQLAPAEWGDVFALVHKITRGVAAVAGVDGVNVGFNTGAAAGQTVQHAHVHAIPAPRRRHP